MTKEDLVLALYPNHNGFGYAFFEGPEKPVDCGMAKVRPISNRGTIKRLKGFIEYTKPKLIILQTLTNSKSFKSKRVRSLLKEIGRFALKLGLKVKEYTREDILAVFSQFQNAQTKYAISKCIVYWFPEYKSKMPRPRKLWQPESYSMGMFDAMSLALTHYFLRKDKRKFPWD